MFSTQAKKMINRAGRLFNSHKELVCAFLFAVFFAGLLQSANTGIAVREHSAPGNGGFSGVLTASHGCEAPALRHRPDEPVQLNARSGRNNPCRTLVRVNTVTGGLVPETINSLSVQWQKAGRPAVSTSIYHNHSPYIFPVRAGPGFLHD